MTGIVARVSRALCVAMVGAFLAAFSPSATPAPSSQSAAVSAPADSSLVWRWSALYRNRLDIIRSSAQFPWNDEEASSHLNDRLALLGELALADRITLFAKGATGLGHGGDYQKEQFVLEEGHLGFALLRGTIRGRLFTRERIYRTDLKLLELLSNDAAFVRGRGEGLSVEAGAGAHVRMNYIESVMRSAGETRRSGGLPTFEGAADVFRALRLGASWNSRCRAAFMLSQTRSTDYGDAVMVETDLGMRVLGCNIMAELARTQEGDWDRLRRNSLFDVSLERLRFDSVSSIFSQNNAFSVEADVPRLRMGSWGSVGVAPGYRFWGGSFADPEGEAAPGLRETYATAWWKPLQYDALLSIDASDGSVGDADFRTLAGGVRLRLRGGFELRESALCREGKRCTAIASFIDDNELSRMSLTARIDELGGGNDLSFIAESGANIGSSVSARSVLYLYRSWTSYYHMEVDFRPRERFFLRLAAGSFAPQYDGLSLGSALEFGPPRKERSVVLSARVWFGRI